MAPQVRITWIVVANGRRARIYQQLRRGGRLNEQPEWDRRLSEGDVLRLRNQRIVGSGALGFDQPAEHRRHLVDEAEQRFLKRYAGLLRLAAALERYHALILIAPPRALGLLQSELCPHDGGRVECSQAGDRVEEAAEALRERVRKLRLAH